jgi:hypothetical protein
VQPDELDSLGGMCTFSRPRQLCFASEALSWGGEPEATRTERLALDTLDAYAAAPAHERSYSHEAGARIDLALARISNGEVDGAAEALVPVLELPPAQRIHSMVTERERVRTALSTLQDPGRDALELAGAIEAFTSQRLTRTR